MSLSQRIQAIAESSTTKLMGQVQAMKAQGQAIIPFNAGEPDFNSPAPILEATIQALNDGKTKYSAVPGLPELRAAIAKKMRDENKIDVQAENILIANGSKQILYNIFQTLCDPGDEVIIPGPYWVTFPESVKLAQGVPVFVDTDDHQISLERIQAAVTSKTKAILINSPNNPTGAVYSPEVLKAVGEFAAEQEIYIIADEAYEGLVYDGNTHVSMASLSPEIAKWTLTSQTFSKSYCMTGFRIGWLAADVQVIKMMNKLHSHLTGNVCTFAQYGGLAALSMDPQILNDMQDTFQKRLDLAYGLCSDIFDCVKPGGAFYLFPDVSKYLGERFKTDDELAEYLLEKAKVAVVPGSAFGAPGHLRVSFSTSEENIQRGFDQIKAALL